MDSLTENRTEAPEPGPPTTVIIIDDHREICNALQDLFEAAGDVDVLAVGYSGEDAVRLATKYNPQVILLDLHFPEGIDGIEAIRQISGRSAEVPITSIRSFTFTRFAGLTSVSQTSGSNRRNSRISSLPPVMALRAWRRAGMTRLSFSTRTSPSLR